MQRCAFCQGELDPATRICRSCGRVQPVGDDDITLVPMPGARETLTRHCPQCNELLPAAARFCGKCGQTLIPLAEEVAGKKLHDTGLPAESNARDQAITNVLSQAGTVADMPAPSSINPDPRLTAPIKLADKAPEAPEVTFAVARVENGAQPRKDIDTRQGRSGVAHGLRYRLLSRMQSRIVTTALVALLVVGTAAGVGTRYFTSSHPGSVIHNGSTPTAHPLPTTNPLPSATPISSPVPTATPGTGGGSPFVVNPTIFSQTCAGAGALAPLHITLMNIGSQDAFTWQVIIPQTDPKGHVWATASPTNGTLDAGQQAMLTITPISALCQDMQGSAGPISYTVTISYTQFGQTGSQDVTDTVTPPT